MVCYHQSEWGVDFASLKPEIETLLDEGIALEEGDKKQALEDKKAETLKITEEKIKAFNFWESVEIPEISIKESSESGEMKNHIPQKFELKLPDKTIFKPYKLASPFLQTHKLEELELPGIPEIEMSYSKMPAQPKFWHFNPVAFVEHMKRMYKTPKFLITIDELKLIFPNSTKERRNEVEEAINKYSNDFEIDNIDRMSHFLGQIGTETGELMHLKENYNYSAETIYNIFLKKVLVEHLNISGKYTFKYHDLIEGYNATLVCEYSNPTTSSQKNYGHKRNVQNPIDVPKTGSVASWSYADF